MSQSHAGKIQALEKWVENRNIWRYRHVGPLAIHAGKGRQYLTREELANYTTSAIVAVAIVEGVLYLPDVHRDGKVIAPSGFTMKRTLEILEHAHTEGPYCVVFARVLPLERPVACSGAQGLWNVSQVAIDDINQQLRTAYE